MSQIVYAWVPGLPHVLRPDLSKNYETLAKACEEVGEELRKQNVDRILYYSTQWLSVLGQSIQTRGQVSGVHVDENWYEIATLPFNFKVDKELAANLLARTAEAGLQARGVDYEGFPVDTGTIVANKIINKSNLAVGMYSSCVYSDYAETLKIGQIAKNAASTLRGKTAIVAVSGLSGRYFTTEIDYREDHIRDPKDDVWNQKILAAMAKGDWNSIEEWRAAYCSECKVDMGLKALAFLAGAGACERGMTLQTKAYASIYGTGAAVLWGAS